MSAHISTGPLAAWYALHTKPRQEMRAYLNLGAWGVEAFVPWVEARARSSNPAPMFPGYIFARFDIGCFLHHILFTRGVSHVVSFGGIPAIVEEDVIATIRSRTDQHGVARAVPNLKPGDSVMVQAGPLRNLVGIFEKELPDNERIEILLATIAYSARIRISKYDVQKLETPRVAEYARP
jgi:transcriptional antiterminator RfaH